MASVTISKSALADKRLKTMVKGVSAAAKAIDDKLRSAVDFDDEAFQRAYRIALVTLTYRPRVEWDAKHISVLLKHYREYFRRRKQSFNYVWVMELHASGVPHYHIVCWFPRGKGMMPPLPDKQGWWPHGMTNAKWAKSPVGYIVKYASKGESKSGLHLPKGARLWGYGGLVKSERAIVAYATAPKWLKALVPLDSQPAKRVVEQVVETVREYRTTAGAVRRELERVVNRFSAWVCRAGDLAGAWFISPYEYEGFFDDGISVRHRGFVECGMPSGDVFCLAHSG